MKKFMYNTYNKKHFLYNIELYYEFKSFPK